MIFWGILIFIIGLCYGSFLNMLSYRLISGDSLLTSRSFCPSCKSIIKWYDLFPIISFFILNARCRSCYSKISYLYPFIEFLTGILSLYLIFFIPSKFWLSYFFFLSALIVTIRTDLETLLIPRLATLFMVPFGILFTFLGKLPIDLNQSFLGISIGYGSLWLINKIYFWLRGKEGIGEGDFELLAMVGSFTGLNGILFTLKFGSLVGSIILILLLIFKKINKDQLIPFGPFLAFGAIIYIFIQPLIFSLPYLRVIL